MILHNMYTGENIQTVCSGKSYQLQCGTGDGTYVMSLQKLYLMLNTESEASGCQFGICNFDMGGRKF